MARHPNDFRVSSPAVQRARERVEARYATTTGRTSRDVTSPAGVKVDLDVLVEDLGEAGVDVKETLSAPFISELLDDGKEPHWTGREASSVEVHLEREAAFVRVTGRALFSLSHPCVRCLNEVPFDFDQKIDLRLVERAAGPIEADLSEGDADGDDFEGHPLGDAADLEDLDVASYEGGVVRLGELIREQLFLELPLHPACDSARASPKQPCGFHEEKANADEKRAFTESKWAALASLREKLVTAAPSPPKNGNGAPKAPSTSTATVAMTVAPTQPPASVKKEVAPVTQAAAPEKKTAAPPKAAPPKKAAPIAKKKKPAKATAKKKSPQKKAAAAKKPAKKKAAPAKKAAKKSKAKKKR